jgi:hypothetical protein
MNVISITVSDEVNPNELQAWFDANPTVTTMKILNDGRIFFIFYE